MNVLFSVFALGVNFTPGCLPALIINKLLHAGVGLQLVHGCNLTWALACTALQCEN